MTSSTPCRIEIIGEGKTDIGPTKPGKYRPEPPTIGVVPILVHQLCGRPKNMLVVRRKIGDLEGRGIVRKVQFARLVAMRNQSDGCVLLIDSEGDLQGQIAKIVRGRNEAKADIPMAIGVAHPCIESWLLTDRNAIQTVFELEHAPDIPDQPEQLPPPSNRDHNPKTELTRCAALSRNEVKSEQAWEIAKGMKDLNRLRERCPLSFAPFAAEVEQYIKPLFA